MREILFRGKRIDNGEWVYGDLVHIGNKSYISYYYESALSTFVNEMIEYDGISIVGVAPFIEVDPTTVGQYTGLTDKNGKKIFEGDILKVHDLIPLFDDYNSEEICYNGKVMYIGNQGMYACEGNGDGNALCVLNLDECQVIGNIHDNPELLGVSE